MTNIANFALRAGPFPLKRILVLSDLSDAAENAAWRAGLLAQEHGAWLRIVHVSAWREGTARAQRQLNALAWRLQEHLRIVVVAQSLRGSLRRALAAAAREADLLVTGASASRWTRGWVAGMHPLALVQLCGLPTLVARKPANMPYQRVIAGVEHGPQAATCIAAASAMAGGPHVQLLRQLADDSELMPREDAGIVRRAERVEARIHQRAQATPGARMKEAPCVVFTRSVDALMEMEGALFPDLLVVADVARTLPSWLAPSLTRELLAYSKTDTLVLAATSPAPGSWRQVGVPSALAPDAAKVWSS